LWPNTGDAGSLASAFERYQASQAADYFAIQKTKPRKTLLTSPSLWPPFTTNCSRHCTAYCRVDSLSMVYFHLDRGFAYYIGYVFVPVVVSIWLVTTCSAVVLKLVGY
jgi:hypothetical protein